jgi:flagellar biosynthetic protein FliR
LGSSFLIRLLADLVTGVSIGLVSTLVVEAFTFSGQVISVQAGFSYASTIDPFSESDSGILPSLFSLAANLLLFHSPLYGELIRALMAGLLRSPDRSLLRAPEAARILIGFSAHCLEIGIKLALPIIALRAVAAPDPVPFNVVFAEVIGDYGGNRRSGAGAPLAIPAVGGERGE